MRVFVLIMFLKYVFTDTDLNSSDTFAEIAQLNKLQYEHESHVISAQASFTFTILNLKYAIKELNITSYYISIMSLSEQDREERTATVYFPTNDKIYKGVLNMQHLDHEENYFLCVFFYKNNTTSQLVGSSRFCHVVSISGTCDLEYVEASFTNQPAYLLLILVAVILIVIAVFTTIRDCIYRPRTIDAILRALPQHHAHDLESLADVAAVRRKRGAKVDGHNQRNDSISTVDYDPAAAATTTAADAEFLNYHGYDSSSLSTTAQ